MLVRLNRAFCLGLFGFCFLAAHSFEAKGSEYVGAPVCGSCHPQQHAQWKATGHAKAFASLSASQQRDPACRSCHTMNVRDDDPGLRGVQCESCHGPGRAYAPLPVMRDEQLRKLLGLERVSPKTCAPCHSPQHSPGMKPFDFESQLHKVKCVKSDPETKRKAVR
jgi:hypothetical protein